MVTRAGPRTLRALAVTLGLLAGLAPPVPCRCDAAEPLSIRVMSFNVRYGTAADGTDSWENRRQLLLETIRAFSPDLLGTQECLAFQAEWLGAQLPGYGMVGAGREDGRRAGEMCAVFFREDRFAKLDEGHFWLSETPEVPGSKSWDSALPRMVTWVELGLRPDPGPILFLFDTHFDHAGQEARARSAELLRRHVLAIAADLPAVITGDFNAPADPPGEGPCRLLLQGPGAQGTAAAGPTLVDAYRRLHPEPAGDEGTFHAFTGRTGGPRIDWIVVSPGWEVLSAAIDRTSQEGRFPSDHFPVTAVLRLQTP